MTSSRSTAGRLLEDPDHERGRHAVGQVGHERHRAGDGRPASSAPVELGAASASTTSTSRPSTTSRSTAASRAVDLDGEHRGARCRPGRGSSEPRPAPISTTVAAGADLGQPDDPLDGVGVDDEVLAEALGGPDAVLGQQSLDVRARQAHQEMVTLMVPWLNGAIASKPDGERSTTWGGPAASRSSTTQVMVAPVAMSVMVSVVPNGSHGLAHLPGGASAYQVAMPLALSLGGTVVGGGVGRVVVVVAGGAVVVVGGGAAVVEVVRRGELEGELQVSEETGARRVNRSSPTTACASGSGCSAPSQCPEAGEAPPAARRSATSRRAGASPRCFVPSDLRPSSGTSHPSRPGDRRRDGGILGTRRPAPQMGVRPSSDGARLVTRPAGRYRPQGRARAPRPLRAERPAPRPRSPSARDALADDRHAGRLVALSAVRHRGEERAVGLDQQAVGGTQRRGLADLGRVLEGDDAAEGDEEPARRDTAAPRSGPPVKQWSTVRSGTPSASSTSKRSSQASRAWITRASPCSVARAICAAKAARWASRGECS